MPHLPIALPCRPWMGYIDGEGYGRLETGMGTYAHRAAWQIAHGHPVPRGLVVDHTCHNQDRACAGGPECLHRRCIEPTHLEAVTPAENKRRGNSPAAKAARQTHCIHGHPFDARNTYIRRDGRRVCKACRARRLRQLYAGKRGR